METKYIDINNGDWGIVFVYDYDITNFDELAAIMDSFGLSQKNVKKALRILSGYNTGMAVSRDDLRMSAIFISRATNGSEFWSTAIHEAKHVADAIIEYYGADWHGEDEAYLTGYITKRMVELLGEPCYD